MTSLEKADDASSPIRGPGDGMETEQTAELVEAITGANTTNHPIHQSPHKKAVSSLSPGVLQLGKVHTDKSVEIEAIRILVPKAAITHVVPTKNARVAKSVGHKGDTFHQSDGAADPKKEQVELKNAVEKLKNSEKRLLQDKEGLSNQLRIQTEVNRELKKLLVASVGDDLEYHFERMAREKNQLILENEVLGRNMSQLSEQLERMSIQCDVWRSKFLASSPQEGYSHQCVKMLIWLRSLLTVIQRSTVKGSSVWKKEVMADELTNTRAILQRQTRDAQSAIQDLLNERDQFRQEMIDTQKLLEELMVSLQWGRQQTYYPSAQPYTTTELAAVNCKLAKAVSSHLLGNVGTSSPKKSSAVVEFCNTPAEKMAEMVLRVLDPAARTEATEVSFSETSPSSFLSTKKNIGRFHPYTRYEDVTFNCCNHCQGELIAL